MRMNFVLILSFFWFGQGFGEVKQLDLHHDRDLTSFISRPDIKAPLFDILNYEPDKISPGYWFVAPYWQIGPENYSQKFQPCQVGPHIYDSDGTLIWSGACLFDNVNIFDFKVVDSIDDQYRLTMIQGRGDANAVDLRGTAHVLNTAYEIEKSVVIEDDRDVFDIHEFNVLDNGRTALITAYRSEWMNFSAINLHEHGWVRTGGFEEIDWVTGDTLFDWRTSDHIPLSESSFVIPPHAPHDLPGWDYIHVNSVDKDADGNYLLSSRFANTIYLISGQDGEIIWRLGGTQSDFELENFRMYRQHHARIVDQDEDYITISFLNNASDEGTQDEHTSDALIVKLNLEERVATAILRLDRPSGGLTRLRGNVQLLPDGNIFVGWSESGYHSEFTPDGECVMEARFRSDRYSTYRAYKYEFAGIPAAPPDLYAAAFHSQSSHFTTVFYVSWNGATDIASWNFYAQASHDARPVLIGSIPNMGFETAFTSDGYMDWVSVEAVHVNGSVLRRSPVQNTIPPTGWSDSATEPVPDDPEVIVAAASQQISDSSSTAADDDSTSIDDSDANPYDENENNYDSDTEMGAEFTAGENNNTVFKVLGGIGGILISLTCLVATVVWVYRRRQRRLEDRMVYKCVPTEEEAVTVEKGHQESTDSSEGDLENGSRERLLGGDGDGDDGDDGDDGSETH